MAAGTTRTSRRGRGRWWWLLGRLVLVLTVIATLALLIFNRTAPGTVAAWRAMAADAATPVLDTITTPVRALGAALDWTAAFFASAAHVRTLEARTAAQQLAAEQASELQVQHSQLMALMKVVEPRATVVRTVRIVGASSASFLQSAVITAGQQNGIRTGQPVRDADGLVGQIIEVGQWSSRVLLITDTQSRIPVRNARTGQPGYVTGDNSALMSVSMAEPGADSRAADLFVTSGEGGIFPPGIPVGRLVSVSNATLQLAAAARLRRLNYALVLRSYVPDAVSPPSMNSAGTGAGDSGFETTPPGP